MLASVLWTTVFAPQRSSFRLETDRIPRDPAPVMFAMSRTVILEHRGVGLIGLVPGGGLHAHQVVQLS